MNRNSFLKTSCLVVLAVFSLSLGANQAWAQKDKVKDPNSVPASKGWDPNSILARIKKQREQRVTNEERKAAAQRLAKAKKAAAADANAPRPAAGAVQGGVPDYVGIANWANSPVIRKFVDTLPGLGAANANNVDQDPITPGVQGQYISVANPDTITYPGSDYYEIELREYTGKMHSDLSPTRLRGYVQVNNGTDAGGSNTIAPAPIRYLGPTIVSQKDRPVRIKFINKLPTGMGGDLFVPTDTTVMGSGMGPYMAMAMMADRAGNTGATVEIQTMEPHNLRAGERIMLAGFTPAAYNGMFMVLATGLTPNTFQVTLAADPGGPATMPDGQPPAAGDSVGHVEAYYAQNRATLHLHGGRSPWISDGTPHQWTTPAGEITQYPEGVSVSNVPDMPDPGDGSLTFFYSNQQSARLMFYHDHAWGITRLNVYAGEAAGYLITDATEQDLVTRGIVPAEQIPLIVQDKSFVDASTVLTTDPTWNWGTGMPDPTTGFRPPVTGDLWYPHVYVPAQNPYDVGGANAFGRWHYGPWFFPPTTGIEFPPVPNPYYDPVSAPWQPPEMPGTPNPSMPGESFLDIAMVNGTAYPTLSVQPRTYRLRILNAANDRFFNLHMYVATSIVGSLQLASGGSGYADDPSVTITPAAGDTTGHGATATATVDPVTGAVDAIFLETVGSGYTAAPTVLIADPPTLGGVAATASATLYTAPTEVGMVPAVPTSGFPALWPKDGRAGGVPDPATRGPKWIQIGTEGGFLPAPAVIPCQPIVWNLNPTTFDFGNVYEHSLLLGCAERADVIVDFSAYAGKTLIVYNDAPAAFPALDSRYDYYTGAPDQRDTGGYGITLADGSTASTLPGFSPNTRTVMQIVVGPVPVDAGGNPVPYEPFDIPGTTADGMGRLEAEFASTGTTPGVFARSQPPIIVTQKEYNSAYNQSFPAIWPLWGYVRIQDWSMQFHTVGGTDLSLPFGAKAIHDEMGAAFDEYGRMAGRFGLQMPNVGPLVQNFNLQNYVDPVTEIITACPVEGVPVAGDGTQIWRISHNGVDTHPIHFHLFDVQLLNRVGWDGAIRLPNANELGWKETIRTSPLEDTIVALRPVLPKQPFGMPDSVRPLNPMEPIGSTMGFSQIDPYTGDAILPQVTNQIVNFGWEYVWHCHILSHEEMDMMRPVKVNGPSGLPAAPVLAVLGGTQASLSWTDATLPTPAYPLAGNSWADPGNEVGFRIERAIDGGPFAVLGTAIANATSFTDLGPLSPSADYSYRVVAFNAAGETPSNVATLVGVPAAPSGLSATATAAPQVDLTWTDNSGNETSFEIQRSLDGTTFAAIATVGSNVTSFADTTVASNTTYWYQIVAVNGGGSSAPSNIATVTTPGSVPPPAAPSNLSATLQGGLRIRLVWRDNATTETGFVIQRDSGAGFVDLATVGAFPGMGFTAYTDIPVLPGVTYTYRVKAMNGAVSSAYSNSATVSVPGLPAAPSGLSASAVVAGTLDTVTLNWTDNATNETSFTIQRSTSATFTAGVVTINNVPLNSTSYVQTNVLRGMTYYYRIRAANLAGISAWSNTASVLTP